MHACLTNTVCTNPTRTITRARKASSKQKTKQKEGEADEEESSAAPVDDEHTRETGSKQAYRKQPPLAHPRNKQTQQTHSSNKNGEANKNARSTHTTVRTTQNLKKRKKGGKKGEGGTLSGKREQYGEHILGPRSTLAVRAGESHPKRLPRLSPTMTQKTLNKKIPLL